MSPIYLAHCITLHYQYYYGLTHTIRVIRDKKVHKPYAWFLNFLFSYWGCLRYFKTHTAHTTSSSVVQLLPPQLWSSSHVQSVTKFFLFQTSFGIRKASPWPSPLCTGKAEAHSDSQKRKKDNGDAEPDCESTSKQEVLFKAASELMSTWTFLWHQKCRQVLYRLSEITYPGITSCHGDCLVSWVLKTMASGRPSLVLAL